MRHDAKIENQDPRGMKGKYSCPECRRETTHSVLAIINSNHFDQSGLVQFWDHYLTIRCDGCGTVSFCHVAECSENEDFDQHGTPFLIKEVKQYPAISNSPRSEALERLVSELSEYSIDLNQYYDDAEPQGVYDSHLSGKLDALSRFCRKLGWSDLVTDLQDLVPLQANAPESLTRVKDYVLPEISRLLSRTDIDAEPGATEGFWQMIHPRIAALARPRFEQGFFGDAVETSFKEVNETVKRLHLAASGRELDGAGLMTTTFSPANPVIRLSNLGSASERDEQQGYMQIFAGAMTGIRNPKAHGNLNPDPRKTLHLISLASLLMCRLDERI